MGLRERLQHEEEREQRGQRLIEIEGKPSIYVFNGFFMCATILPSTPGQWTLTFRCARSMRSKYTAPGLSIYYYTIEWDPKTLSWADFRGSVRPLPLSARLPFLPAAWLDCGGCDQVLGPTDPKEAPTDSLRGVILKK